MKICKEKKYMDNSTKIVFIHGFSDNETRTLLQAVKTAFPDTDIAFAMSTETNKEWLVKDLIREVSAEHAYMKSAKRQSS